MEKVMTREEYRKNVQALERKLLGCKRPDYHNNGRTLKWGQDLNIEVMVGLRDAEVFTLLNADGLPAFEILMDAYGQLREYDLAKDN